MAYSDFFNDIAGFLDRNKFYFDSIQYTGKTNVSTLIEPRTREANYAHALSFEVFDPFWLLARQWQFGRFKGNDCGSPVTMKIRTIKKRIDAVSMPHNGQVSTSLYNNDSPMEYSVEKEDRKIDLYVSVESAAHLKKRLLRQNVSNKAVIDSFIQQFPLDSPVQQKPQSELTIEDLKIISNEKLVLFYNTYKGRIFDGYKVFLYITDSENQLTADEEVKNILLEYAEWFRQKFMPNEGQGNWNISTMSYSVKMEQDDNDFIAGDYDSGCLSWYSFDHIKQNSSRKEAKKGEEKLLSYIPTSAVISGAPSQRLWEMENSVVEMGNADDDDFSTMANSAIMQYISMYSNDWMITPLEAEAGVVLDVGGIAIKDTFGEYVYIDADAEDVDFEQYKKAYGESNSVENDFNALRFIDRWNMFGNSHVDAYNNMNFSVNRGLFVPASVPRNEERLIEEVQFLRDELANMLWGVEKTVSDQAGGTISGESLSDKVLAIIDKDRSSYEDMSENDVVYSYLLENRVPINWIPFVPQHIPGSTDSIRFRRGTMPIFFNGYCAVRPSSEFLKAQINEDKSVVPMYINEEEVIGYGVKLKKTAQRTRWFLGKSFNWVGNKKRISEYQANSGLMFDELIEKESGKAISLKGCPATGE